MFLRNASSLFLSFASLSLYARAQLPLAGQTVQFTTELGASTTSNCLTATQNADGAAVIIDACGNNATQLNSWVVPKGAGAVGTLQIFGDKCLDVTNGIDADGTKLQIWTCATANTNQMWLPAGEGSTITWSGENKCVDVTNGNIADGNQIQVWDCDATNINQRWNVIPVTEPKMRTISLKSNPKLCVTASSNTAGSPVTIAQCSNGVPAQAFSDNLNEGQLDQSRLIAFDNMCVTVAGDVIEDGTKLVLEPCNEQQDGVQIWGYSGGVINLSAGNPKLCMDLTSGNQTEGNQLQIWTCAAFDNLPDNANQDWVESFVF